MEFFAWFFILCIFGLGISIGGILATVSKASRDDGDDESKTPKCEPDAAGKTVETRDRFPVDMALRRAGFAIYARQAGREPVWIKGGVEFRESEAVMRLSREMDDREVLSGVYVS